MILLYNLIKLVKNPTQFMGKQKRRDFAQRKLSYIKNINKYIKKKERGTKRRKNTIKTTKDTIIFVKTNKTNNNLSIES